MKVLQVGSSLFEWGGIDRWIIGLMAAQRDRGAEVHLTCKPGTFVHTAATTEGIPCHAIAVHNQQDWRALVPYIRLLRRERFDVMHAHYSVDFIIPAVAARICRVPAVVMTRHMAWSWRGFKRRLYSEILYDKIIAVAEAVREALLAGGIAPDRVETVLNGVNVRDPMRPREEVRQALGLRPDQCAIGIFARVIKEKGHRFLIEALPLLPKNTIAVVVGTGEDWEPLKQHTRALGLTDQVTFTGYVEDVEDYINAVDIVAAPSTWPEPFPSALLEPMMLGLPVVASRVGGVPEMVKDGETGLLVPKEDVPTLAAAIGTLVGDPSLRARLGRAARTDTRERFSTANMAAGVEEVYQSLLSSNR